MLLTDLRCRQEKNERLIPKPYDALMITLIDYRINAQPPESVKSFDFAWIANFFLWIRENGYIENIGKHTMNFNPFKPDVNKFKNKNRLKAILPLSHLKLSDSIDNQHPVGMWDTLCRLVRQGVFHISQERPRRSIL